jgi:beta-phosphoglucomutase
MSKTQRPWAAFFDVDGTMVDNGRFHELAWIELGRRHGVPLTPEIYRTRMHAHTNEEIIRDVFPAVRGPAAGRALADEKEQLYRELFRPHLREIPGLKALLRALKAERVPCAALSNAPAANVDFVIDELNLRSFFAVVLTYTDVPRGKPAPDIYLAAAERLGVPIRRCVIFEDSPSGFAAAASAGAPCIAITAGMHGNSARGVPGVRALHRDFTTITLDELAALTTAT